VTDKRYDVDGVQVGRLQRATRTVATGGRGTNGPAAEACNAASPAPSRQQGAWADHAIEPAVNADLVGDLDLNVGTLVEGLNVAIRAVEQDQVRLPPRRGCAEWGVIQLMTVIPLHDMGARNITVVDLNPWVLEMARQYEANHTVRVGAADPAMHFDQIGVPDPIIKVAGAGAAKRLALGVAGKDGAVVFVGTPTTNVTFGPETRGNIPPKELTTRSSWMPPYAPVPGSVGKAAWLLVNALADYLGIVTHQFGLDRVSDSVTRSGERRLRAMLQIAEDVA
jgi:threonine dehydrogenase-like Zn-dependent dehydrogenase